MEDLLSHDRIISYHRSRPDYKPSPENTLQFAYGDRRYEKFAFDLTYVSNILKLKILNELTDDFHRGDNVTLALLSSDLLNVLINHLIDENNEIRQLVSMIVKQISSIKQGRDILMCKPYATDIIKLIDDGVPQIRINCYNTLLFISEFTDGVDKMLEMDLLNLLVNKIFEEKEDEILLKVLQVIRNLLYGTNGTEKSLETPIITRLSGLLDHKIADIREFSIICLSCLSFKEKGKIDIINEGCVVLICKRLSDPSVQVRISASMTLSSLAQMKAGKVQILENKYFEQILNMLDDKSEQVRLNIVQLISSVSEHPEGRKIAKQSLNKLNQMKLLPENSFLNMYIDETMKVITWMP